VSPAHPAAGAPAAFFDVDDTLITVASLFDLLAFEVTSGSRPRADHDRVMGELRAMKAAGAGRAEVNRTFYRAYAGWRVAEVAAGGRAWFRARSGDAGFFRPEAVARLRAHADAGHLVVLVSGSHPACLRPLAAHLGAHRSLCSRPATRAGRYTGALRVPMIGAHKGATVRSVAARWGVDLAASWAYGDHESDLPLLDAVGHPVVVGPGPGLAEHARRRGWPTL
jgi:HAD superfamily hydrolase (TIGR01490 family)